MLKKNNEFFNKIFRSSSGTKIEVETGGILNRKTSFIQSKSCSERSFFDDRSAYADLFLIDTGLLRSVGFGAQD